MKNETFTPERIKAEADAFFEWDGEDRSLVTTTSCLLFAQHIAGLIQARAAQPAPVVPEGWKLVPVEPTPAMLRAGVYVAVGALPIYKAMLAAAPAQGQQVECQECGRLRGDFEELAERYGKLQAGEDSLLAKVVTERDQALAELSALKAQQAEQKPVRFVEDREVLARLLEDDDQCIGDYHAFQGATGISLGSDHGIWRAAYAAGMVRQAKAAPQPAPAQDVAGLASSDPAAKAEFETLLRKEFESRWPKPKGVTWGAGINDYCVSEFAEGIALSYPDMWMAYKAGAMRTNQ